MKAARAARLAVLDDLSCTAVVAKMTALIADDNAVSLPHASVFVVGPISGRCTAPGPHCHGVAPRCSSAAAAPAGAAGAQAGIQVVDL